MKRFWILAVGLVCSTAATAQGSEAKDKSEPVYSSQLDKCLALSMRTVWCAWRSRGQRFCSICSIWSS